MTYIVISTEHPLLTIISCAPLQVGNIRYVGINFSCNELEILQLHFAPVLKKKKKKNVLVGKTFHYFYWEMLQQLNGDSSKKPFLYDPTPME